MLYNGDSLVAVIKSNDHVPAVGRFTKVSGGAEILCCSMEVRHCFGSFPCGLCSLVYLSLVYPHLHQCLYHLSPSHILVTRHLMSLCSAALFCYVALFISALHASTEINREERPFKRPQDSGEDRSGIKNQIQTRRCKSCCCIR